MGDDRFGVKGPSIRIVAFLLLPAAFIVLGGWEVVRGDATVAELARDRDRAGVQLERLQSRARTDPYATVTFRGDEQAYAAPLAATMMADCQGELGTDLRVAILRVPSAWLTVAAALVALVAGLSGLAVVAVAARRSMRSRPSWSGPSSGCGAPSRSRWGCRRQGWHCPCWVPSSSNAAAYGSWTWFQAMRSSWWVPAWLGRG